MIVAKFGGSSLADANQIRKVQDIIKSNPLRRYIVVSAPGKRNSADHKITDLLILCHERASEGLPFDDIWQVIADRFIEIADSFELPHSSLTLPLTESLELIKQQIDLGSSLDCVMSRGEYLNALLMSAILGYEFVDASRIIHFYSNGRLNLERTNIEINKRLKGLSHAVIPGFYGLLPDGGIKTFSRGGSDVTGAILARCLAAKTYENWTDVSGMMMADPRIVDKPKPIRFITYRELRELTYMGASVLHEEVVNYLHDVNIPINIRNTNDPANDGTTIYLNEGANIGTDLITGIAGRKNFTVFAIEKNMMNQEIGFGSTLLGIFAKYQISYEHTPTGIDTMSVVIADRFLESSFNVNALIKEIQAKCKLDKIEVLKGMSLIAIVGKNMARTPGVAAQIFTALANGRINIRMIDQGSSEINIIIGVESKDFEEAIRAIYKAFN